MINQWFQEGYRTFLATTRIQSREQEKNRTNKQTWTICLGLTQEQKGSMQHYISDSIYGLTLAWITSDNSTKQLECRLILTRSSSLSWTLSHAGSPLCSGVRSRLPLSVSRRQLPWAPLSNQLSSRVPLPLPDTARFQVQKPFVWFHAKTDKGIVCLAGHPHSVTNVNIIIINLREWNMKTSVTLCYHLI